MGAGQGGRRQGQRRRAQNPGVGARAHRRTALPQRPGGRRLRGEVRGTLEPVSVVVVVISAAAGVSKARRSRHARALVRSGPFRAIQRNKRLTKAGQWPALVVRQKISDLTRRFKSPRNLSDGTLIAILGNCRRQIWPTAFLTMTSAYGQNSLPRVPIGCGSVPRWSRNRSERSRGPR